MVLKKLSQKIILSPSEREVLLKKIHPFMLVGCIIWLAGELIFGYLFTATDLREKLWNYFSLFILIDLALFITSYFVARAKHNTASVCIYLIFAFTAGMLTAPLMIIIGNFAVYFYGVLSLGMGGMILTVLFGLLLGDRYFSEKSFWYHLSLILIGIFLLEGLLIYFLRITSVITIIISLVFLVYTTFTIMLCGALLSKEIKEEYWTVWAIQILILMFITLFFALLVILIILVVILGQGDIDVPDIPDPSDLIIGGNKEKEYQK